MNFSDWSLMMHLLLQWLPSLHVFQNVLLLFVLLGYLTQLYQSINNLFILMFLHETQVYLYGQLTSSSFFHVLVVFIAIATYATIDIIIIIIIVSIPQGYPP